MNFAGVNLQPALDIIKEFNYCTIYQHCNMARYWQRIFSIAYACS